MVMTQIEQSRSAARPHVVMWPCCGGYEEPCGPKGRADSLPPTPVVALHGRGKAGGRQVALPAARVPVFRAAGNSLQHPHQPQPADQPAEHIEGQAGGISQPVTAGDFQVEFQARLQRVVDPLADADEEGTERQQLHGLIGNANQRCGQRYEQEEQRGDDNHFVPVLHSNVFQEISHGRCFWGVGMIGSRLHSISTTAAMSDFDVSAGSGYTVRNAVNPAGGFGSPRRKADDRHSAVFFRPSHGKLSMGGLCRGSFGCAGSYSRYANPAQFRSP